MKKKIFLWGKKLKLLLSTLTHFPWVFFAFYLLCHFSSFIGVNCNSWQVARYNLLLRLFVSDNYISDIEQFDLKSLSSSLKTLILAGNSLTSVPEGRAHLRKLNIASPLLKSSTFDINVSAIIQVSQSHQRHCGPIREPVKKKVWKDPSVEFSTLFFTGSLIV